MDCRAGHGAVLSQQIVLGQSGRLDEIHGSLLIYLRVVIMVAIGKVAIAWSEGFRLRMVDIQLNGNAEPRVKPLVSDSHIYNAAQWCRRHRE